MVSHLDHPIVYLQYAVNQGDTPSLESFLQEDTMQGFLGYIKVG